MYNYRRTLLSRSQHSSSQSEVPVRRSPFSPFEPPRRPPLIKIDLASDQSKASSYTNGSSSNGSAGFAVFEFATKYPSLWTVPARPDRRESESGAGAGEEERRGVRKGEGEEGGGVRASKGTECGWEGETAEVPELPKNSVFRSDYGYRACTPDFRDSYRRGWDTSTLSANHGLTSQTFHRLVPATLYVII